MDIAPTPCIIPISPDRCSQPDLVYDNSSLPSPAVRKLDLMSTQSYLQTSQPDPQSNPSYLQTGQPDLQNSLLDAQTDNSIVQTCQPGVTSSQSDHLTGDADLNLSDQEQATTKPNLPISEPEQPTYLSTEPQPAGQNRSDVTSVDKDNADETEEPVGKLLCSS